jgi:hypothetical protein
METRLERAIGFPFYNFLVKARNPKTNEIKMVDWFQGKVTIERSSCNTYWYVRSYSQKIMDFWLEKFGSDSFFFNPEDDYQFHKVLKETAKFVDAPYIEGCALTKEWVRYSIES